MPGGDGVDLERRSGRAFIFEHSLGKGLVELFQRALGVALVEEVHCAIIAQATGDDRVRADLFGGAREQGIGFGVAAEVRLLQRFVGDAFGATQRRIARAAHGSEEFGGLGVIAGIVAAISFGERAARVERSGLHASERSGVADAGRRDRNLALDRLVGNEAAKPELDRAVVAAEALGLVEHAALAQLDKRGSRRRNP